MSSEETVENHTWISYLTQKACDFHLGFGWISKLTHVKNFAIFY